MGSELPRLFVAIVLSAVGGLAQVTTVPTSMAGVEGGGGTNIPFGSNLACRYQVVYDVQELPWTGPRIVTGISLRPDFVAPGLAVPGKQFLDISVLMSTTARNSATVSATFAENYGTDATWVIDHRLVALPAQPTLAAGPRPANIDFMFTVPWAYGLTPVIGDDPAPTNLLVEIWIHSQPSGAYRIDNLSSCIAPTSPFGNQTAACAAPGKPPVVLTSDLTMLAGSSYSWHIANAEANAPFLLGLSGSNTGFLFGAPTLPLPVPLYDLANPSLPTPALPLGGSAPGCWLNIDPLLWLGGICNPTGSGSTSLVIPPGRDLVGTTYHAQALVATATANTLQMLTSDGRSATVCGPLGVARVYAFYDAVGTPPQPVPTTGSMQYGVGPILDVH